MEMGVKLRVGALPGYLTDVKEERGEGGGLWSSWADYRLVQHSSLITTVNSNSNSVASSEQSEKGLMKQKEMDMKRRK